MEQCPECGSDNITSWGPDSDKSHVCDNCDHLWKSLSESSLSPAKEDRVLVYVYTWIGIK